MSPAVPLTFTFKVSELKIIEPCKEELVVSCVGKANRQDS